MPTKNFCGLARRIDRYAGEAARATAVYTFVLTLAFTAVLHGPANSQRADAQEVVTLEVESAPTVKTSGPESAPASDLVRDYGAANENEQRISEVKADARSLSRAFRDAARKATPSVVTVFSYGQNSETSAASDEEEEGNEEIPPSDEAIGPSPPATSEDDGLPLTGLGSGVIVDLELKESATQKETKVTNGQRKDYWVITNNHVIADAQRVVIQLPDETELTATSVFGDPDSDMAVLRLETKLPLTVAKMGDSDQLEIGDWVLAIGSPFKLEATVSAGIISAKNRILKGVRRSRLFQTDAAINPGNSGGPLVDLEGNVIAINTAIATRNGGYQGIGFAIPVNQSRWIARELAEFERVRRAAIGVRIAELNPKLASKLKLPTYLGVLVHQIITGSAAEQAGLQSMDVILEFAGQRVRRHKALQLEIERQPVGSTQEIKIYRGGEELIKEILLAPVEDPTETVAE